MDGVYYDDKGNLLAIVNDKKKDLFDIIKFYGGVAQERKAVEELIELAELLIKDVNKDDFDFDDICSEVADVYIMLAQIKIIFDIDDEFLQAEINRKIDRTLSRIENEAQTDCPWK